MNPKTTDPNPKILPTHTKKLRVPISQSNHHSKTSPQVRSLPKILPNAKKKSPQPIPENLTADQQID
jgi:hypothetical protein